ISSIHAAPRSASRRSSACPVVTSSPSGSLRRPIPVIIGASRTPAGNRFDETGPRMQGWRYFSLPQEVRMGVEQSGAQASRAAEAPREDAPPEAAAPPDLDETKRKFREALERKRRE